MAIAQTGSNTATGDSAAPSITHGLTINSGDIVLIQGNVNASSNTWSDNNGSTPLTIDRQETGSGTNTLAIMTRIAGASEPSSYAFTVSASNAWSLTIRVYSGGHADIWDVAPAAGTLATGSGTTATSTDMTTNTDGAMGLVLETTDSNSTDISSPTNGYGDLINIGTSITQASAQRIWATAQTTGTVNLTLSKNQDWAIHHVALKPAAGGLVIPVAMNAYRQRHQSVV